MNSLPVFLSFCAAVALVTFLALPVSSGGLPKPGDANCDGSVNSIDAALVLQLDAGFINDVCGDVDMNRDGVVDSLDAMLILLSGLEDPPVKPLPGPRHPPQPTPAEPPELATVLSLIDLPNNEAISVALSLLNDTKWPIKRQYTSSQRHDVVVRDDAGDVVWNWSHGRAFSAVIGSQQIQPGERVGHAVTWDFADNAGSKVDAGTYELHMFDTGCSIDPTRQCDLGETIAVDIPPPPDCIGKDGLSANLIVSGGRNLFSSGDNVSLTLALYNCGEEAINRGYSSGQQYDFVVQDEEGEVVWAAGGASTLALTDRTFEPGEMFVHRTIWRQNAFHGGDPIAPGAYTLSGFDASTCHFNSLEDCDLIASQTIELVP